MGGLEFLLPCTVPQYLVVMHTVHVWPEMLNEDCNILPLLKIEYFWELMAYIHVIRVFSDVIGSLTEDLCTI